VTLEAVVLPSTWGDLGTSSFMRHGGLGVVGARMAQHPADEVARWVSERLAEEVLSGFLAASEPAVPTLSWDEARLGSAIVAAAPPPRGVRIGWFESRKSLEHKVATSQATFMGETDTWRETTTRQVREHAASASAHAHTVADGNVGIVQEAADRALASTVGGLRQASALSVASADTLTGASGGPHDPIADPPFPPTEPLDVSPLEAEYGRLRRVAANLPESVALAVYALATYLLTVVAVWGWTTGAYPGVRGILYAVGGPFLAIGLIVGLYGLVKRRLLQREVTLRLPALQQRTLAPWAWAASGVSEAVSVRWQIRAMRQAAAGLRREAGGLRRAVALTDGRLTELRAGPRTTTALAESLTASTRGVRSSLLAREETVDLANAAFAEHRSKLGQRTPGLVGSRTDWAGDGSDEILSSIEQEIRNQCRDVAVNGLQLSEEKLTPILRERLQMARPLAPFDRSDVSLGPIGQSLMFVVPERTVPDVPPNLAPTGSTVLPVSSPNKVYVLRLWTDLIPADFQMER
jgi:hypothetical protein